MAIEHVSGHMGAQNIQKGYFDAKRKIETAKEKKAGAVTKQADAVQISEDAKRLMENESLVQKATEQLETLPEVRQEKVDEVSAKLKEGHYLSPEAFEKITDAVLDDEMVVPLTDNDQRATAAQAGNADMEVVRWDKIKEVQQKVQQGFYDNVQVLNTVVSKLLNV